MVRIKHIFFHVFLCIIALPLVPLFAADFSSSNFIVRDPVVNEGASFGTSSSFQLFGSFGQNAIGKSSTSSFSLQSGFLYFPALTPPPPPAPAPAPPPAGGGGGYGTQPPQIILPKLTADFNGDGAVNIVDLSILLYYFNRPLSPRHDLSGDGRIDIVDASILLYYWTEKL